MEAMGFAEMVAETKVLKRRARDAHVELGPMDFGKGPQRPGAGLGPLDLGDDDPKIFVSCRSASPDK